MHKLINIEYDPTEKKLRQWSGSCRCGRWNGMGPNKKDLKHLWTTNHLNKPI